MGNNSTEHINEVLNKDIAQSSVIPSQSDVYQALALQNDMLYVQADAFVGNPYALLGSILEIRKTTAECPSIFDPTHATIEFSPLKIQGARVDEQSKIKEPIKRQSIMVDQKIAAGVSFLNYLTVELEQESSFSVMVFDQAAGLVNRDDSAWGEGVKAWKNENQDLLNDPSICYIHAIIGFVQKYVIRRKYKKFKAGTKGGAFGVNLNGELFMSSEDYSLDIRYGLQTAILHRPKAERKIGLTEPARNETPSMEETALLKSIAENKAFAIR